MLDSNHLFDITIIGGGPVGMFAAYYAGMRKADVQIIESLPELGGQVATLYPEKQIYDVAGFSGISGAQLTENLIEQLALFQPTLQLSTAVQGIEPQEDGTFVLKTTKGTTRTKGIIIAVGNGALHRGNSLSITIQNGKITIFTTSQKKWRSSKIKPLPLLAVVIRPLNGH